MKRFLLLFFVILSQAQVTKTDNNTEYFINGSSIERFFTFTASDFSSFPTSNVDKVIISVEFAVEDLEFFFNARNEDLALRLTSPLGTTINLVYDSSGIFTGVLQIPTFNGTTINQTTILFDDSASSPVSINSDPQSGTFKPEQPLSILQNENAIGIWKLEIGDGYMNSFGGDEITYFNANLNIYPSTTLNLENVSLSPNQILKSTIIEDILTFHQINDFIIDRVHIYDLNGKLVKYVERDIKDINVSELQSGNYILKVFESKQKRFHIVRFIKL